MQEFTSAWQLELQQGPGLGDMQQEAAWVSEQLACASGSRGSATADAALSIISTSFAEAAHSRPHLAAAGWQAQPLGQAALLDEMQLAASALAEAVSFP